VSKAAALPIERLFVANRGEIAERIRRTAERLGIEAVLPHAGGNEELDLLDAEAVVSAAVEARSDALHPGFGFLAESASFAEAVRAAGIRWVGPPPSAIAAMGDKAAARRLAASLGIPVIPGYEDDDQTDDVLSAAARVIGYPLLVKPAGGGGGKGMRAVRDAGDLGAALGAARREAQAAFGDDRLVLERLVEGGRHVEVQVLFDAHGAGIHLGERDCSIQRRHQKILEESPSPAVDTRLRARLTEAALALARAVGYVSAGTVEFLVEDDGGFHFLEMNTRLQVEHPVTELVTGVDLVEHQLRIAAGEPLALDQAAVDAATSGHAVEVRVYAEDAESGFLPATGRIERLRWPEGEGIRVDAGVREGDRVTGRFDPMLAKVVARAHTRDAALDRLAATLDATVILGIVTNLRFLRWLVCHPIVRSGDARTDTLERIWPPDDWRSGPPPEAWSTAAAALAATTAASTGTWGGGWRLNASGRIRVRADETGESRSVGVPSHAYGLGGHVVSDDGRVHVDVGGRSVAFRLAPPPDEESAARAAARQGSPTDESLAAPMPGTVIAVHVAVGQTVDAGAAIATLEAMKMEHVVAAPHAGTIHALHVRGGDQVARGQLIALVEPSPYAPDRRTE